MAYKIEYKENGVKRSFRRSSFYEAVCEKNKLLRKGLHNVTITDLSKREYH